MVAGWYPRVRGAIAVCVMTLILIVGCAGRGAPDWVMKGSDAFSKPEKKAFYGVGSIQGVQNLPLARTAADNRGRAEIARILETYIAALMRDYASATTGDESQRSTEQQYIEQTLKAMTKQTMSGVEIIDRWMDEKNGTMYSLARLDLDVFKANMDRSPVLQSDVRNYIRKNAKTAFDELTQEERQER